MSNGEQGVKNKFKGINLFSRPEPVIQLWQGNIFGPLCRRQASRQQLKSDVKIPNYDTKVKVCSHCPWALFLPLPAPLPLLLPTAPGLPLPVLPVLPPLPCCIAVHE